ncbi:MAG: hypothetical protein ACR2PL_05920 [Dehalococcoidia bacterium]
MALHQDKTFFHKDVTLDGNVFEDCTFTGCTLRFNGSPQVGMVRVKVDDCRLVFGGPALATIHFLGLLYTAGLGEYADEVIGGVQAGAEAGE